MNHKEVETRLGLGEKVDNHPPIYIYNAIYIPIVYCKHVSVSTVTRWFPFPNLFTSSATQITVSSIIYSLPSLKDRYSHVNHYLQQCLRKNVEKFRDDLKGDNRDRRHPAYPFSVGYIWNLSSHLGFGSDLEGQSYV